MGRHIKVLSVCVLFLLALSVPASAGTIKSFSNVKLTGNSGSLVSGQFSFDPSTHMFSGVSMTFNSGFFGGVQASGIKGQGVYIQGQGYLFAWASKINGNSVWCSILFNPTTGQFHEWGGISKGSHYGGFDTMSVPEGGAELTYLMLSAMAVFGGILISGKQRRTTRSSQSS